MKYIFVTGGVVSGLGKGICAASLGRLLKQCGLKVKNQKFDPYLNVDPGTMSPYQHGEVFVTDDGAETDLDLGHYERFVDEALDEKSSVSSGKIFWSVLNRERQGGYLGGTVRLGKYPCVLEEGSLSRTLYDAPEIWERHRHRYEFNNDFRDDFTDAGMRLAGLSPDGTLVEIVESKSHPWFVGAQFHPEFKSRPNKPHPLFHGFVAASLDRAVH